MADEPLDIEFFEDPEELGASCVLRAHKSRPGLETAEFDQFALIGLKGSQITICIAADLKDVERGILELQKCYTLALKRQKEFETFSTIMRRIVETEEPGRRGE